MRAIPYIFVFLFCLFVKACSAQDKPNVKDVQASEIIETLDNGKDIYMTDCVIHGDLDFTALKGRKNITREITSVYINNSLTFAGCTFAGKVKAFDENGVCIAFFEKNLTFTDCDFRDSVDFSNITVNDRAFVSGNTFRKDADWKASQFRGSKTYFSGTKFESGAFFQNCIFDDADFMNTSFGKSAMFQKVRAHNLMFGNSAFKEYADFTYCEIGKAVFNYCEFNRSDFSYSIFGSEPEIVGARFIRAPEFDNVSRFKYETQIYQPK